MRRLILIAFISVPLISATVSMFHVWEFLQLGNSKLAAGMSALAYELGQVCIMLFIAQATKIKKTYVWISFLIVILIQVIGNIYVSYNALSINGWSQSFHEMCLMVMDDLTLKQTGFALAIIIGAPVPIIALLLSKSLSDLLSKENDVLHTYDVVKEEATIVDPKVYEAVAPENTAPPEEKIEPAFVDATQKIPNDIELSYSDSHHNNEGITEEQVNSIVEKAIASMHPIINEQAAATPAPKAVNIEQPQFNTFVDSSKK